MTVAPGDFLTSTSWVNLCQNCPAKEFQIPDLKKVWDNAYNLLLLTGVICYTIVNNTGPILHRDIKFPPLPYFFSITAYTYINCQILECSRELHNKSGNRRFTCPKNDKILLNYSSKMLGLCIGIDSKGGRSGKEHNFRLCWICWYENTY